MKKLLKIGWLVPVMVLFACQSEPSIQKYYVENQNNPDFVVIDVPASLFLNNNSQLPAESQKALNSIKKANVLVFPLNDHNEADYKKQAAKIKNILNNKRYKLLMKFGSSGKSVKVMYLGDTDAIDEIIVFGKDDEKGFGLVRILGEKMNPSTIMKLMQSAGNGKINVNMKAFGGIGKIFNHKQHDSMERSKDTVKTKHGT